jgi:uncharacterized membrane protein HdeD (DUF308 family)
MSDVSMGLGDTIRKQWGWMLAVGILFVLGGIFAILSPLIATLVVTIMVGAAFIVSGAMEVIQAWGRRSWSGFLWEFFIGLVVLVGGIAIVWHPIVGALTITLVLAAMFVAKGVFQLMLGFKMRPMQGWGWIVAAGVLAILVGLMILSGWPFSSVYAPGVLAGISLTFTGWSYIALALAARRL